MLHVNDWMSSPKCGECLVALEPFGSLIEACWRCPECLEVTAPEDIGIRWQDAIDNRGRETGLPEDPFEPGWEPIFEDD